MPKKTTWTLEKIRKGFENFYTQHNRYPTATEIDRFENLPSTRQIQRRFGGLPQLRKLLKLDDQYDLTTGEHSSRRAHIINQRAIEVESEVYKYLVRHFGIEYVHREYMFNDDGRSRTDFYVFTAHGNFSVDVFYPNDTRNMNSCINVKLRKYYDPTMMQYPVIFLQMNQNITEDEIQKSLQRKKKKLQHNQFVMTWDQFQTFCKGKQRKTV